MPPERCDPARFQTALAQSTRQGEATNPNVTDPLVVHSRLSRIFALIAAQVCDEGGGHVS